jgi:transcription antitermination factor NusG
VRAVVIAISSWNSHNVALCVDPKAIGWIKFIDYSNCAHQPLIPKKYNLSTERWRSSLPVMDAPPARRMDITTERPGRRLFAVMPILAAEPTVFPETLFHCDAVDFARQRWSVLHTRPRQEKSLARQLHEKQIAFYLPLISKRVRVRKQVVRSYHPVFPGYLFLLADEEGRLGALGTRRVATSLDVNNQQQLWNDLRQIHRLIDLGLPIRPEDQLAPGVAVEINAGPLAGLRGVIVKSASGNRFVVKVDFIQRGASVLLDDFTLTPCKAEPPAEN